MGGKGGKATIGVNNKWNEECVAIIQSTDNGFAIHKSVSSVDIGTTKISAILLTRGDG